MRKLFLVFAFLLSVMPVSVLGYDASFEIEETGSVLNYYDMYYVVDVEGEITITNDMNFTANSVELRVTPGTLSFSETDNSDFIYPDKIKLPYLDPGESRTIPYRIYGVTTQNVAKYYESDGESVLRHIMDDDKMHFHSDLWINLKKSEIFSVEGKKRRTIDMEVTNPRPVEYQVNSIKVHRTEDKDINDPDKVWTFDDPMRIYGGDSWSRTLRDESESMREDSVYWLIVDHELADTPADIMENNDIDVYDESELDDVPEVDEEDPDFDEIDKELRERTLVFLRKLIEPSTVQPGDFINVTLIVTNLDYSSKTINVKDAIPDDFKIDEVHTQDSLVTDQDSEELEWEVTVNRDTSRIIQYSIEFVDDESLGLEYLPAAEAIFPEGTVTSTRAPYIRRFIPQKQLYVQKQITRLGGDRAEIDISVRNIGEKSLSGLVLKEYLEDSISFSDITQENVGRGEWELPELDRNEEWSVSYKTDYHRELSRLPQVFGIRDSNVLKTVITDSRVSHFILAPSVNIIEILGMTMLIIFPFIFIKVYKKKVLRR